MCGVVILMWTLKNTCRVQNKKSLINTSSKNDSNEYCEAIMKIWECVVCGIIYDEAKGWPEEGIAPGTAWGDIPNDWECPDCGVGKAEFEMVAI